VAGGVRFEEVEEFGGWGARIFGGVGSLGVGGWGLGVGGWGCRGAGDLTHGIND
jgi:hypothetical protein